MSPPVTIEMMNSLGGYPMRKISFLVVTVMLLLASVKFLEASKVGIAPERIQLIKEIQSRLNVSFQCEFSVSIGQTRKYAMANSSGIIIVDSSFLQTADRSSIFFAIAHEYAHAYLQHDVRMLEQLLATNHSQSGSSKLLEVRRQFEKEADGIAARKAKQMGFAIEALVDFILAGPDPEKGIPPENRVYSKPRERADYILAVYQSS